MYKPGETVYFEFGVQDSTGAATNADSTPTAVLRKNGSVDAAVTITIAGSGTTGGYKGSFAVPGGYAAGDTVIVSVQAVVDGITGTPVVVFRDVLDSARSGQVYDRIGSNGAGLTALGDTRIANLDVAVSSRNATTPPTAAANASAVRTELMTELGRVDTTISSRSSHSVADIWAAVVDSAGVSTLLSRLSALRAGYLDKLNVTGTLANTDNADSFKADVSGVSTLDATAVQTASEAALTAYDAATGADVTDAQTALETAIAGIEAGSGGLTDNQASQLGTIYTSVQGGNITVTERVSIGNKIIIYRGDRMIVPFEDIGDVSDGRQVWFTVKATPETDTDAQAIIQIKRNGGLSIFQAEAQTGGNTAFGYFEFDDEVAGTGRIILKEDKTRLLTQAKTTYDIQMLDPDAGPRTIVSGAANVAIASDVTRAIA